MKRVRIGVIVAVLGGAAGASGFGTAADATHTCAGLAALNASIQRTGHEAANALRDPRLGQLNSLPGDFSRALDAPGHLVTNAACNALP